MFLLWCNKFEHVYYVRYEKYNNCIVRNCTFKTSTCIYIRFKKVRTSAFQRIVHPKHTHVKNSWHRVTNMDMYIINNSIVKKCTSKIFTSYKTHYIVWQILICFKAELHCKEFNIRKEKSTDICEKHFTMCNKFGHVCYVG